MFNKTRLNNKVKMMVLNKNPKANKDNQTKCKAHQLTSSNNLDQHQV